MEIMRPAFTTTPRKEDMVADYERFSVTLLCIACGWEGTFDDGSTDHFFNHTCKMRTESVSGGD
jgi:hypothetical protein